jgi:hypothetical protein
VNVESLKSHPLNLIRPPVITIIITIITIIIITIITIINTKAPTQIFINLAPLMMTGTMQKQAMRLGCCWLSES